MEKIVGIDEVGRGSWAGPVVAAAVRLNVPIAGLTDSKLLSSKQRELLAAEIMKTALWAVSFLPAAHVDSKGLTATIAAVMQQALLKLKCDYDKVILDGSYNFIPSNPRVTTIIKADLTIPAVSAASILAKVARDRFMTKQAEAFPNYGFEKHVGYGTLMHRQAIMQYGVCPLHRRSYKPIKTMLPV